MSLNKPVFVALLIGSLFVSSVTSSLADSRGIEQAGSAMLIGLSASGVASTLARGDREGARQMGSAMVVTITLTVALKHALNEKRPNGKDHSFPSGHSSIAFSVAEFMRARYGWAEGGFAYGAASFVACSRVLAKQHYVHDVVAGALLGATSAFLLTKPYKGWQASIHGDAHTLVVGLGRRW